MGFAYETWRGVFYPVELPDRTFLPFYCQVFNAVEVDSTFYGTPREGAVQRWSSVTPEGFSLCAKMPRVITHEMSLVGAQVETAAFLETMRQLGAKLGPILIQFPPSFTAEQFHLLNAFLAALPPDLRFAVEFRHGSWYTSTGDITEAKVADMLSNYGFAGCDSMRDCLPHSPTADFLYIRWIGQHGSLETQSVSASTGQRTLEEWLTLIQPSLAGLRKSTASSTTITPVMPRHLQPVQTHRRTPITEPPNPKQGTLFD
jgi:uncharacterized protein YecE (DUF72 family)